MTESFLYAGARTVLGRYGGALAEVRPDDLSVVTALTSVLAKAPLLDPEQISVSVKLDNRTRGGTPRKVSRSTF